MADSWGANACSAYLSWSADKLHERGTLEMSGSWKIARIAGIPIYIHWTFLILIGWIIYGHWSAGHDVATTVEGVGFVLAVFGCVVLHEMGHALTARHFGIPTSDITLLPIGGVARLQRMPDRPGQELQVALAGPAVNVAIVAILYFVGIRPHLNASDDQFLIRATFLPKLMFINIFLALFNLLPAFPMDGGRVLRALLALRLEYGRATRIAANIGQAMAMLFGFLGLMGNPILLLIALFVWLGAEGEARQVQERLALRDVPVRAAMLTDFQTLSPSDSLGRAADLLLAGSQRDFPVVDGSQHGGVLTREALMTGLAQLGRDGRVGQSNLRDLETIEADASVVPAISRLREGGVPCLQVLDHGRPVGLLTLENVGEYLMVRAALAEQHPNRPTDRRETLAT
jgi:Zn-dependent protease